MPTVFTVLRAVTDLFYSQADASLGFYGAFGYDLAFQFDAIDLKLTRPSDQRDMVLYLPDEILVVDNYSAKAWVDRYDFEKGGVTTEGKAGDIAAEPFKRTDAIPPKSDHRPGEYAELVTKAKESFRKGDLFEVVPGQKFMERCDSKPSDISKRLKAINPSPYSFFINLGNQEYLVGASPEMFVRVSGRRIETCPISGTIKRGDDPIADSEQILKLLEFQEGRVRAHHVLGRRPQRQKPRLRAGFGQGHRPPADRDVFAPDPHGRPYRRAAARRHGCLRRFPQPRLGGHRHRRARSSGRCASSRAMKRARAHGMVARSAWSASTAT